MNDNECVEFVLRQELRTLNIVNESKSREITTLQNWVNRLKEEKETSMQEIRKMIGANTTYENMNESEVSVCMSTLRKVIEIINR